MKRPFLLALIPALSGFLLALLINTFSPYNPIFYMRASLSVLVFFAGLLLALLIAGWTWQQRLEQRCRRALATTQQELAAERLHFLRRLDHELKNPLTAIRTGLANVVDAPMAAAQRDALETVQAQALRLSRLTANLRKMADLETRPLEWEQIDPALLLRDVVESAADLAETAVGRVRLSIPEVPWPLPPIHGDRDLLFLALYNLLDNALKYTPPTGMIELRAREAGNLVVIEVADTGPGIPVEEITQVWNELYRGRCAHGTAGSGLGLSLVKAIVERHHGQVALHSRCGQGTLVTLSLPLPVARERQERARM